MVLIIGALQDILCSDLFYHQHIHRFTQNNTLNFGEGEFDKKEGSIVIYSDTALEKFMKYSQENHRGRKKKEKDDIESE